MVLIDLGLFRVLNEVSVSPMPAQPYEARVTPGAAQVHTTSSIDAQDHLLAVRMRVPVLGYLRAVWISSVCNAAVLILGRCLIGRVQDAISNRADAAVALLLLAPSWLAAYLIRPHEHAIASHLLRPMRYLLALAAALSYVAAALLVLNFKGQALRNVWTGLAGAAGTIAMTVTVVIAITARDLKDAAEKQGTGWRTIEVIGGEG